MKTASYKKCVEMIEAGKVLDIVATNKQKEKLCIRLMEDYPKDCRVSQCLIHNVSFIGNNEMLNDKFRPEQLNVTRLVIKKMRQRISL